MFKHGKRSTQPDPPILLADARSADAKSHFKSKLYFISTWQFSLYLLLVGICLFVISVLGPLAEAHWAAYQVRISRLEIGGEVMSFGFVAVLAYRRWDSVPLMVISVIVALVTQQAFVGNIQAKDLSDAMRAALKYCIEKLGEKEK